MEYVLTRWPQISQHRALLYRWLSNLYALELTTEQITLYQSEQIDALLDLLVQSGLGLEVARLQQAIQDWQKIEHLRIELAADFAQLFLMDGKSSAVPYASKYLDNGQLYGSAEQLMRNILRDNHLEIPSGFKEPADHLAVILAIMGQWVEREQDHSQASEAWNKTVRYQHNFLQQMLLTWLQEFTQRTQMLRVKSDFYPALSNLLFSFVQVDTDFLSSCLPHEEGGLNESPSLRRRSS